MARRFFYVCAGLFLLAGAYALGVRNAGAQAGTIAGPNAGGGLGYVSGSVGRTFHYKRNNSTEPGLTLADQIPGTSPVVATASEVGALFVVLLENGDVYRYDPNSPPWIYYGNLFGGPTPTERESFGSVKARYR